VIRIDGLFGVWTLFIDWWDFLGGGKATKGNAYECGKE
jgi:hypothetical protein